MPENKNNSAITPPWLVEMGREVLGEIDIDPATSARANRVIKANIIYTARTNGLRGWAPNMPASQVRRHLSVWLNPPGGITTAPLKDRREAAQQYNVWERRSRSLDATVSGGLEEAFQQTEVWRARVKLLNRISRVKLWWNLLLHEREQPYFGHALFLAFNIEAIRLTQSGCPRSLLDFETCVPRKRIDFLDGRTGKIMRGNRFQSSITYIPGAIDRSAHFHRVFGKLGQIVKVVK